MDISRSTYYYKSRMDEAKRKEDMDIRDRLEELALRFPALWISSYDGSIEARRIPGQSQACPAAHAGVGSLM